MTISEDFDKLAWARKNVPPPQVFHFGEKLSESALAEMFGWDCPGADPAHYDIGSKDGGWLK